MASSLELYCLVKAFYDHGKTIISCFMPFLLEAVRDGAWKSLTKIAEGIENTHRLKIPFHVLTRIVRSAARESLCEDTPRIGLPGTRITDAGKNELDKLESFRDVDRRIKAVVSAFAAFGSTKGFKLHGDEYEKIVTDFITVNADPLLSLVHEGKLPASPDIQEESSRLFIAFLLHSERSDPPIFTTLQDMILGATIASILNYHKDAFDGIQDRKFSSCTLYFDANYLFSLLGLHADEYTVAAKELYELLVPYGFNLSTFDFTVSEMCRVLRGYFHNHTRYPTTIRVDSIYSNLRAKGYRESDIVSLISNLEDRLSRLKIGVKRTGVDLSNYEAEDKKLLSLLIRYKSYQPSYYQNHDIAVLEKARKYRKRTYRRFEDANCFVVTSDFKLAKLNYLDMGHKENQTIGEVILDRMLTTILFLKNPQGKVPIGAIIASYSRGLFVSRHIWDAFYHALCDAKTRGAIDDKALSLLFYNGFIEEELSDIPDEEARNIDQSYVIAEAEKAAERHRNFVDLQLSQQQEESRKESERLLEEQQQKFRDTLHQKEQDFLISLSATRDQIEWQKDRELASQIRIIENNLRTESTKASDRIVFAIRVVVGLLLLSPAAVLVASQLIYRYPSGSMISVMNVISYIIALANGGLQIIKPLWEKARSLIADSIFKRRRKGILRNSEIE